MLLDVIFPHLFKIYVIKTPKKLSFKLKVLIFHKKKIFKFSFTLPVESYITFLNLVLAVSKWAVGRFKNVNSRLYKESRAKLKYAP